MKKTLLLLAIVAAVGIPLFGCEAPKGGEGNNNSGLGMREIAINTTTTVTDGVIATSERITDV